MADEIDPERAFNLVAPSDLTGTPPSSLGTDLSARAPLSLGDLIGGRFRLIRFLARGGMGGVFVAEEAELQRQVAVKFMLQSARAGARERFLREAEVTARIQNPHVIQIHEAGSHRGHDYLVYELIEGGRSLGDAFGSLELEERLDLVEQVAEGVGAAHAHGIGHRDLKPENVLIRDSGEAVVADFGLAGLDESDLTNTGQTLGTPAYMAPEQLSGTRPTPACDTWSLGLLLYEAIFQRHPLVEEGTTLQVLLAQISSGAIEVPPCPTPGLRRLLLRSLTADIGKRPVDGAAFKEALVAARIDFGVRGRLPALLAGLALTLLVGALAAAALLAPASPGEGLPASAGASESPSGTEENLGARAAPTASPDPSQPSRAVKVVDFASKEMPRPDFAFSLEKTKSEQLHFLSDEEVLFVSSAGQAQRWGVAGAPGPAEGAWNLPAPFRVESALAGKRLLVGSRLEAWILELPSHEAQKLPEFGFVPSHLALFGSAQEPYLLAASKSQAVWGKVGEALLSLDLEGFEVRQVASRGAQVGLVGTWRRFLGSRLYLLKGNTASLRESPLPGHPSALAFSPDGARLLLGDKLGGLSLRDERDKSAFDLGGAHESEVRSVAWSKGRLAAVSKYSLSVWDADDPSQPLTGGRLPPGGKGDQVYLSPSGDLVIVRRNAGYLGWRLRPR